VDPVYFRSPADLRDWLERHHDGATELAVGFWRTSSGNCGLTWAQAVDEALCFGWIDGVRRRVDDQRYTIRFTPRRPNSSWSAVNVARVAELTAQGRMRPAGLAAFERRTPEKSGNYSYENRPADLEGPYADQFRAEAAAWAFFRAQPPSYRRTATWWVISAKKEETRQRRLATLIEDSAHGRRLGMLRRPDPAQERARNTGPDHG
jgi:uncharacterized protein YdeI (YjbR/CyaY-like superfamily)